jgi:aspartate 1-decarboxylase
MRIMLKSKIHRARVTAANIDYAGSIAIDERLMQEADILPYEQVQVLNLNNGARFTTYAIKSEQAGEICLNGAAARLAAKGDIIIILSYCQVTDDEAPNFMPRLVYVDAQNAIAESKWLTGAIPL